MIQIISTTPTGPDIQGLMAASAGDAASFMALLTQALTGQGAADSEAGNPLLASLLGDKGPAASKLPLTGKPDARQDGKDLPAASRASDDADADRTTLAGVDAALLSMLGFPVPVEVGAMPAPEAAATAGAVTGITTAAATGVATASPARAMAGLAPLAIPSTPDGPDTPLLPGAAPSLAGAPGDDAQTKSTEKKLPDPMAIFAEPSKTAQVQPRQNTAPSDLVAGAQGVLNAPTTPGAEAMRSPELNVLALASNPDKSPTLDSPLVSAPAPQSAPLGQEAALLTGKVHAIIAASPEKVALTMQSSFGTQAWPQELGDKLVWMAGRQGQTAELVLNPPSLGAVEVRLNLSGTDASAQFFSANPNVREAIEAALPKLREMMVGAGISLGDAMVSNQSFGQRDRGGDEPGKTAGQNGVSALAHMEESGLSALPASRSGTSLLDYFA